MHFWGYLGATIYFQMPKQFRHQQSGSLSTEATQFSLCKQIKQFMKNTYSVTTVAHALLKNVVLRIMFCLPASSQQHYNQVQACRAQM